MQTISLSHTHRDLFSNSLSVLLFPLFSVFEHCTRIKQTTRYKCDCHLPLTKQDSPNVTRAVLCVHADYVRCAVSGGVGGRWSIVNPARPSNTPLRQLCRGRHLPVYLGLEASICANARDALGPPNRHSGLSLHNSLSDEKFELSLSEVYFHH